MQVKTVSMKNNTKEEAYKYFEILNTFIDEKDIKYVQYTMTEGLEQPIIAFSKCERAASNSHVLEKIQFDTNAYRIMITLSSTKGDTDITVVIPLQDYDMQLTNRSIIFESNIN